MVSYICVNDIFAYCSTNPRIRPRPSNPNPDGPNLPTGALCSKNPAKCPSFMTNTQLNAQMPHKSNNRRTRINEKGTKKPK